MYIRAFLWSSAWPWQHLRGRTPHTICVKGKRKLGARQNRDVQHMGHSCAQRDEQREIARPRHRPRHAQRLMTACTPHACDYTPHACARPGPPLLTALLMHVFSHEWDPLGILPRAPPMHEAPWTPVAVRLHVQSMRTLPRFVQSRT